MPTPDPDASHTLPESALGNATPQIDPLQTPSHHPCPSAPAPGDGAQKIEGDSEPAGPSPVQQPDSGTLAASDTPAFVRESLAQQADCGVRDYQLGPEIARGGMGAVHTAWDAGLGREVAVKTVRPEYAASKTARAMFQREARITGSLPHPNIPPVHAMGSLPDGRPFLAMKFVKGQTLTAMLAALTPAGLLRVFEQVCQAVAFAHSRGIIHRDLKPDNVMVGEFGEVLVMDWGLARRPGDDAPEPGPGGHGGAVAGEPTPELTQIGFAKGTPAYMPPEQALGQWDRVDERADVFALGGILCAILTGKPPYTGASAGEIFKKAAAGAIQDALERLKACGGDKDLIQMAVQCLAPDPSGRPPNAKALVDALAAHQKSVEETAKRVERLQIAAEEGVQAKEAERSHRESHEQRLVQVTGLHEAERRSRIRWRRLCVLLLCLLLVPWSCVGADRLYTRYEENRDRRHREAKEQIRALRQAANEKRQAKLFDEASELLQRAEDIARQDAPDRLMSVLVDKHDLAQERGGAPAPAAQKSSQQLAAEKQLQDSLKELEAERQKRAREEWENFAKDPANKELLKKMREQMKAKGSQPPGPGAANK